MEYVEADHAVRYVAATSTTNPEEGDEPPETEREFETVPFEEWARSECVTAAAVAAADRANERLGTDEVSGASSSGVEDDGSVALLAVETVVDRDGDVVSETDVTLEELAAATPRSVDATYVLEGREYAAAVPVYAAHVRMKEQ